MLYRQPERTQNSFFDAPIFYKFLLVITILTGISALFTQKVQVLFINFPYFTIFYLSIWRLFTASLFSIRIFQTIICSLVICIYVQRIQKRISTVIVFTQFFLINILIQLLFITIWIPMYYISRQKFTNLYSNGALPISIIYLIRLCCMDSNDKVRLGRSDYSIKKYLIPVIIIVLSCLLQLQLRIDIIIGGILGILQLKFFQGSIIKLKRSTYESTQNSCCFLQIRKFNGFHSLSNSPQSKYFCKNECDQYYKEFYRSITSQNQQNINQIGTNSENQIRDQKVDQIKSGIRLIGGKQVTTAEDVRSYWANKNQNSLQQQKNQEIIQDDKRKKIQSYSKFQDQKQQQ